MTKKKGVEADAGLTADPLAPGIPSVPGLPCTDEEEEQEAMHQTIGSSIT